MSRETWYVMEDGSFGDPREIRPGKDGVLTHKDGRKVSYAPHGPRSRGVDADAERAKIGKLAAKPSTGDATTTTARDMKAEPPKRGYVTRETKAD